MRVPAIILAAGASRRLGRPKQLVRIGNETLLGRTIRVALESDAGPIFVVLGANRKSICAGVDLTEVETVVNKDWEQGIASSIHAGVVALKRKLPETKAVLLLVCDQPRLAASHLDRLIAAMENEAIVASTYAGITGIPAIFPTPEFSKLLLLSGDTGARSLLRNPNGRLLNVEFEGGDVDVDTPTDIESI